MDLKALYDKTLREVADQVVAPKRRTLVDRALNRPQKYEPVKGASVQVHSDGLPIAVYAGPDTRKVLEWPLTTDEDGQIVGWVDASLGEVDLTVSGPGVDPVTVKR